MQPGQLVRISGIAAAAPLITEAYREAVAAGAHAFARVGIDGLDEIFYKRATDEQLKFVSPLLSHEIEKIDAELGIWGSWNTRSMTNVDPQRMAMRREATREI